VGHGGPVDRADRSLWGVLTDHVFSPN
jgi:hypothetical protein